MEKMLFKHDTKKVLIVEDDRINQEILKNILQDSYEIVTAFNGKDGYEYLKNNYEDISVILLDLIMPYLNGIDFLKIVKQDPILKKVPIIVITSEKDSEVESIKLGAADFISKPYNMPEVIKARVERIIEISEDRDTIVNTSIDHVTGLFNKDYFVYELEKKNFNNIKDIAAVDIDGFHIINGLHGKKYGDEVLITLSNAIREYLKRHNGIASRHYADLFYLFIDQIDNYDDFINFVHDYLDKHDMKKINIHVGVYKNVDTSISAEKWVDNAFIALNTIRGNFLQRIAYYDAKLHEFSIFQQQLIHDMDTGIENHDFVVYYQPKYAIQGKRDRLVSAEALVRWNHPKYGMISPGVFIKLFEKNGLIPKLDHYVWQETGKQIKIWKDKYNIDLSISVNVSRVDILDPTINEKIDKIIKDNNIDKKNFKLEITETAYSENQKQLLDVVCNLRNSGYMIELDDFGEGYSSLNMITSLPLDVIKIDQRFIKNMFNENGVKIIEIIKDIASFINVTTIAEGVETKEQYEKLKEIGIDIIQGYYFSQPIPASSFEKLIEDELDKRR